MLSADATVWKKQLIELGSSVIPKAIFVVESSNAKQERGTPYNYLALAR